MFQLSALKGLRLIALVGLLFGVRAQAQFEVAPDHFDSSAHKNTGDKKAKISNAVRTHSVHNASVKPASAVQPKQRGGAKASSTAQRPQPRRNLQRHVDHAQVAATRRNRSQEEQIVAVSPQ
jgi:hypothetical protein